MLEFVRQLCSFCLKDRKSLHGFVANLWGRKPNGDGLFLVFGVCTPIIKVSHDDLQLLSLLSCLKENLMVLKQIF